MQEDKIFSGTAVAEAVDGPAAETLADKSFLSPPFSPISSISTNFSFQMDASQIPALPAGLIITNPRNRTTYIIQEKLGSGGEGHSYLAVSSLQNKSNGDLNNLDDSVKKKVIKFVPVGTAASSEDLEQKLTEEYVRLNGIIPRNYAAFAVGNPSAVSTASPVDFSLASHLAIISDFVEGRNLEQELTSRRRTYTTEETVDFLLKVVEKQVKPLHQQGLVHRDLKPANIICTTHNDQTDYSVIDFGTLREHNALATVTVTMKGTRGYSRFKGKYECADDYYSLARVAYFLLTGNHPEFVADEKYDKMYDEETFGAMHLDRRFSKVIFRMLGHDTHNRYTSIDELIKDLQKLKRKAKETKSEDTAGMDLNSAQALTHYREAAKFPLDLQRRINGLQERFKEQYRRTKRNRNPLDEDFRRDLGNILVELGYEKWNFPKEKEIPLYVRKRKDSNSIDVLIINDSGDKYFQQYQVKDKKEILDRRKQSADVSQKWYKTGRRLGPVLFPAVGALGFLAAIPIGIAGTTALGAYSLFSTLAFYCNGAQSEYDWDRRPPSFKKCTSSNGYDKYVFFPSHLFGRLFYDSANGVKKLGPWIRKISTQNDNILLERALQPAPYFTYKK